MPGPTLIESDCWPRPNSVGDASSTLPAPAVKEGSQGPFNLLGVKLWAIARDVLMHPSSGSLAYAC